jgi:SAM-dependent methyltransferase
VEYGIGVNMSDLYEESAQYYDAAPVYQDRTDRGFYVARARQARGPVLEVGCGTGRIMLEIALAGVDVMGLDSSPAMLEICRERLRAEGSAAEVVLGDMRNFDLGRKFALITIPFRPLQHLLDPADQIACLESVRRHLAADGRFIFDVFDPRMDLLISGYNEEVVEFEFTGPHGQPMQRSVRRLRHDRARQVQHMELIFTNRQTTAREAMPLVMRYFFRYELEHLLARCGFEVEEVLGDFDGSPVGEDAKELIFVSRVRGDA